MIILTTSATAQNLLIIPRTYISKFTMEIRDDSTNVIVDYLITNATVSGNYLSFSNIFSPKLVENHFYDLYLYLDYNFWNSNNSFWNLYDIFWQKDSDYKEDFYRDKIFCTDQDIDQLNDNDYYQLNKGQYTSYDGFNNDYIVI